MAASSLTLSFTNMSSAKLNQYQDTSSASVDGWKIGYAVNKLNYNLRISFTPSVQLSKVVFTLTADSATGTCYYLLRTSSSHPGVSTIAGGTKFSFSSKKATITLNQTFNAGTTYYLWLGTTNNNYNTCVILYDSGFACTTTVAPTYTISYNGNAQNGGTVSGLPSSQTKTSGVNLTLSSTKPTHTNTTVTGNTVTFNVNGGTSTKTSATATNTIKYTFNNWNTAAAGTGTSYASGASYTANAAATLYAQWTTATTEGNVTLPTVTECTRAGHELLGWAISSAATVADYNPGDSYTPSANITLYAVWGSKGCVHVFDSSKTYKTYQVYIANSDGEFNLYAPYVYTNNAWVECTT